MKVRMVNLICLSRAARRETIFLKNTPQTLPQVDLVLFSFLHSFATSESDASIVCRGSQTSLTTCTSQASPMLFTSQSENPHNAV